MVASGVGKPDGARFSDAFVIEPARRAARKAANTPAAPGRPAEEPVPRLPTLVDTMLSATREEGAHGLGFINTTMNVDVLQERRSSVILNINTCTHRLPKGPPKEPGR